ncbi:MAG TPA: hypothetical protein VKE92_00535, partial [Anaerolineales bacterium]|nr:hypothetical protein [Anaerolineales bacterium]
FSVPLVISIDPENGVPNENTKRVADAFEWTHGPKEIVVHSEHLGLLQNFYYCGCLAATYGSVIFLEDDSVVSPAFYHYARESLTYFEQDKQIAGISLYRYAFNGFTHYPFEPFAGGSDVYFMQVSSIMGQAWSSAQWKEFENWRVANSGVKSGTNETMHELWSKFASDDHFPILTNYLVSTRRYYVFPRVSFTTGFGDMGTHFTSKTSYFQVPLQHNQTSFRFQKLKSSVSVYDSFMEILPECVKQIVPALSDWDFDVDLNATKAPHHLTADFVLTTRACANPVKTFALAMRPLEANLIFNVDGTGINLCRRSDVRWDKWSEFQTRKHLHDYYSRGNQQGLKQTLVYFLVDVLNRFKR